MGKTGYEFLKKPWEPSLLTGINKKSGYTSAYQAILDIDLVRYYQWQRLYQKIIAKSGFTLIIKTETRRGTSLRVFVGLTAIFVKIRYAPKQPWKSKT